jgi:hypothetical protein
MSQFININLMSAKWGAWRRPLNTVEDFIISGEGDDDVDSDRDNESARRFLDIYPNDGNFNVMMVRYLLL